jgi:hypothetical protein
VVVPETVGGVPVGRAAADDPLSAEGGPPLVLDEHRLNGPVLGIEADLARGGVLPLARADALRVITASWPMIRTDLP